MIKIGVGEDSHGFSVDKHKKLILGGVQVDNAPGLEGNSDGDAVLHSLANALSSSLGGDSLGTWSDTMCKEQGIKDSAEYVKVVLARMEKRGYRVGNVSISLEMQSPRLLLPTLHRMKESIAALIGVDATCVGITITSGEQLSPYGKGLGIHSVTNVLIFQNGHA